MLNMACSTRASPDSTGSKPTARDVVDPLQPGIFQAEQSAPVRWVLAVPNDSDINSVKDLEGKRIATEGVGIVETLARTQTALKPKLNFPGGATEVKVPDFRRCHCGTSPKPAAR